MSHDDVFNRDGDLYLAPDGTLKLVLTEDPPFRLGSPDEVVPEDPRMRSVFEPKERPDEALKTFPGGSKRYSVGKPKMHLLPWTVWPEGTPARELAAWFYRQNPLPPSDFVDFTAVTAVFEYGATKYEAMNWLRKQPASSWVDSALRHYWALHEGQDLDKESGLSHIDHFWTNVMMLECTLKHFPEMDDRPKGPWHA